MVSAKKKEKGMVEIESTQNSRRPVYVSLADQFVEDKRKKKWMCQEAHQDKLFTELVWPDPAGSFD